MEGKELPNMAEPIRTCIGCRRKSAKGELIRLVRDLSGQILVDKNGKKPGRGAYVCLNPQCIDSALTPKKLNKVLRINSHYAGPSARLKDVPDKIGTHLDTHTIDNLKHELLSIFNTSLACAPARV